MMFTRPIVHRQVALTQGTVQRTPSPYFAPPVPSGMREPGTNFFTIITAHGPITATRG